MEPKAGSRFLLQLYLQAWGKDLCTPVVLSLFLSPYTSPGTNMGAEALLSANLLIRVEYVIVW